MPDFLVLGVVPVRVLEDSAAEQPSLYQGATERMSDNSVISTIDATTRKRVFECEIDIMDATEESDIRTQCPEGVAISVSGDFIGGTIQAIVTFGASKVVQYIESGVQTIFRSISVHIEEV